MYSQLVWESHQAVHPHKYIIALEEILTPRNLSPFLACFGSLACKH